MKHLPLRLTCLLVAVFPLLATAQNNIISAFDAIIKCPEAKVTESHKLEKDPSTKIKTNQSDIYYFELPSKKLNLIKDALAAFKKDSDMAYGLSQGNAKNAPTSDLMLAEGDGTGEGIDIAEDDRDYIYALFMAPEKEDPQGIHRYAYLMNYKEKDGKITGKIATCYATTLKYRQQQAREQQNEGLRRLSGGVFSMTGSSDQTWFTKLMSYLQGMTNVDNKTRLALGTKAFALISDTSSYPEVKESDKEAAREILRVMVAEKKYSDPMLNKLLNQCLINIK